MSSYSGNDFDIDLTGEKELIAKLKKLDNKLAINTIKKALRKAGLKIKYKAKQDAPVVSGNLKKSIKVFNDRSSGSKNGALIRVGADRKIAPHAHLVEFGTEERVLKKPSVISLGNGNFFTLKHTGKTEANPFFEKAYEASKGEAINVFASEIKKVIDTV